MSPALRGRLDLVRKEADFDHRALAMGTPKKNGDARRGYDLQPMKMGCACWVDKNDTHASSEPATRNNQQPAVFSGLQ